MFTSLFWIGKNMFNQKPVNDEFLSKLEKLYAAGDAEMQTNWHFEKEPLASTLPAISANLPNVYRIEEPFKVGTTAILARVVDSNLNVLRALKFSRPNPHHKDLLIKMLSAEKESLIHLNHQNIMKIYAHGSVQVNAIQVPYYIMDYVEGVVDIDKFLLTSDLTTSSCVLHLFWGVVSAISYMHENRRSHFDIKPSNIFVTKNIEAVVSDLGLTKDLRLKKDSTPFTGTPFYMHPDAYALLSTAWKAGGTYIELPHDELRLEWDLYSLGRTFLQLLDVIETRSSRILSSYQKRYLRLLSCRLLDGRNGPHELAMGLTRSAFEEIKYKTASEALTDMEKLTGSYNLGARIPELDLLVPETIQSNSLSPTPFTRRVRSVVEHPLVSRLGHVSQLGLISLVYPTAVHSRLEHSLGVLTVLCRYLTALYNDDLNPLFRQLINEEDLRATLLAGLLHDVGYYPLAHDVEEAHPDIKRHDLISEELIVSEEWGLGKTILTEWKVPPEKVVEILRRSPEQAIKARLLRSLIDGPLDADKLDYLRRDSRRLGLTFGNIIDFNRLLSCLTTIVHEEPTLVQEESGGKRIYAALGIHEKGKIVAEAVAFARYSMYGQVYWHHSYRAFKAMFHRIVWEALRINKQSESEFTKEFFEFVVPSIARGASRIEKMIAPYPSQTMIHETDLMVLNWLAARASYVGDNFLQMILDRRLFKRLLVISPAQPDDGDYHLREQLFNLVEGMEGDKDQPIWKRKLELQDRLQEEIVSLAKRKPHKGRDEFLDKAENGHPLVLLDIPPEPSAIKDPFKFLIEEDRHRYKSAIDKLHTRDLTTGSVWKALHTSVRDSIGKMRVFCHPDHRDFLAQLPRLDLQKALADSIRVSGPST